MAQVSWGVEYMARAGTGEFRFGPCGGKPGAGNERKQVARTRLAAREQGRVNR